MAWLWSGLPSPEGLAAYSQDNRYKLKLAGVIVGGEEAICSMDTCYMVIGRQKYLPYVFRYSI